MLSVPTLSAARSVRVALLALLGLSAGLLGSGCDGPAHYDRLSTLNYFAYVANAKDNTVSQYRITDSGALTPLSPPTVPVGSYPAGIATVNGHQPSQTIAAVYIINQRDNSVSQFRTDPTGLLVPLQPPTLPTGKLPGAILADISYLFVANSGDNTLTVYDRDLFTGKLTYKTVLPTGHGPSSILVHSLAHTTNEVVYVTNRQDGTISQYLIDSSTGAISSVTPATVATGPFPTALFSPANSSTSTGGITAVLGGGSGAGSLSLYTAPGPNGAISLAPSPNTLPAGAGASAVAENAFSAVVVNTLDNTISLYDVDPFTSSITPLVGTTSLRVGVSPSAVSFSPRVGGASVDHLYVTNAGDNTVSQFQFQFTPKMFSPIVSSAVPTGNFPLAIATLVVDTNKQSGSGDINATIK